MPSPGGAHSSTCKVTAEIWSKTYAWVMMWGTSADNGAAMNMRWEPGDSPTQSTNSKWLKTLSSMARPAVLETGGGARLAHSEGALRGEPGPGAEDVADGGALPRRTPGPEAPEDDRRLGAQGGKTPPVHTRVPGPGAPILWTKL